MACLLALPYLTCSIPAASDGGILIQEGVCVRVCPAFLFNDAKGRGGGNNVAETIAALV